MRGSRAIAAGIVALAALTLTAIQPAQTARATADCWSLDSSLDAEEVAFYLIINQYRADSGLAPLSISTNLTRAADWLAQDMASGGYFSHTDSQGRSPTARAQACGYGDQVGENIAASQAWGAASAAFETWRNSPGHNENMLNGSYKQIGIARVWNASSQYGWYWVTDFGLSYDGTDGSALRIVESGVRNSDVRPGQWNMVTVLPGGLRVSDLAGWTAWDPLPNGNYQQWGPRDFVPGGTRIGLLPIGMSMDRGRNPR